LKELLAINKYIIRYRGRIVLGFIFVALANYFGMLIPKKIGEALDFVRNTLEKVSQTAKADDLSVALIKFSLIVIAFVLLKGFFMYMMRQTVIVVSRLIEYDLRKDIYAHLQEQNTSFYKKGKTGDIMSRIAEDVSKVRNYLGPGILYAFNLITLFVFTIYAMLLVSPKLTLLTLLPLPFLSLSIYYVSDKIHTHSTIIQKQLSKLTVITQEVYSGIRVVKSHGKEQMFSEYFEAESVNFKTKSLQLARVNALFFPLMILLINLSTLIVLLVGGKYVLDGTVTPGNIVEFIIYVNMLTWPVTSIGWIASIIQEAEASQARINAIMNEQTELPNGSKEVENLKGDIIFDNVNFTYPETGISALKNFNLHIKAGEKVAVLGKTASGKSTIAELILRMYDPNSGRILLDGLDLKDYNFHSIREQMAYVPQEVFLFSDTVLANIAFGVENLDVEEARKYAKSVCIDEEIMKLKDGYDTMVGERGVTLSGGQKQRVSITRALVRNPKFVILDDCLSAVDVETEQNILSYLNEALKDKTAIIITHRVHSLQNFDKIIVIDQGEIVEQGTHEELIELNNGYYAQMLENANEGVASWS
jgi:ATP-binding cassette subfamily B protein